MEFDITFSKSVLTEKNTNNLKGLCFDILCKDVCGVKLYSHYAKNCFIAIRVLEKTQRMVNFYTFRITVVRSVEKNNFEDVKSFLEFIIKNQVPYSQKNSFYIQSEDRKTLLLDTRGIICHKDAFVQILKFHLTHISKILKTRQRALSLSGCYGLDSIDSLYFKRDRPPYGYSTYSGAQSLLGLNKSTDKIDSDDIKHALIHAMDRWDNAFGKVLEITPSLTLKFP